MNFKIINRFTGFILLAALLGSSTAFATVRVGLLFLTISPGARPSAMGGCFAAIADDGTASYWNPAGLAFQELRNASLMHSNWLPVLAPDLYYEYAGFNQNLPGWGVIGGNISFFSYGEQTRTEEFNPEPVDFWSAFDVAGSMSYAAKLSENLAAGVNMKLIYSRLSPEGGAGEKGTGTGSTYAVDLGILRRNIFGRLNAAAVLQNIGPNIAYVDEAQSDPLPRTLRLGLAFQALKSRMNHLLLVCEANKLLVDVVNDKPLADELKELKLNGGVEYGYFNLLFLRSGYFYDHEGFNVIKGFTFGGGLRYNFGERKYAAIDFAFVPPAKELGSKYTQEYSISVRF